MDPRPQGRVQYVLGPDGSPLTLADLPKPDTKRWVIRRKAEVVAAVDGGLITSVYACSRWHLTFEELENWRELVKKYGIAGLMATNVRRNRS
ncbi:MAG: DUF1153 domain-containing protein [Patescibacteria group bacterium]|nr:DUF1153 domain-containing protein [Patescibacteria group bacterium]